MLFGQVQLENMTEGRNLHMGAERVGVWDLRLVTVLQRPDKHSNPPSGRVAGGY